MKSKAVKSVSRVLITVLLMGVILLTFLCSLFMVNAQADIEWHWEWVDYAMYQTIGVSSSIALDSSGKPHISYSNFSSDGVDLKYARYISPWTWDIQTVDSVGSVGFRNSLALDTNGNPHISYVGVTYVQLKYACWNGSTWSIQTVDSGNMVGEYSSIELDSDNYPHISYFDWYNGALKYAMWNGSSWSIQTVDSLGYMAGPYNSIALDSNDYPHIAYSSGEVLKYAYWNCSSWNIQTIDSGISCSIALDSNDYPHIAYSNSGLKYAVWNGSSWNIQTVYPFNSLSECISLALDSWNNLHISYCHLDYASPVHGTLMYAEGISTWLRVTNVTPYKTVVGQGYNCKTNVTITSQGFLYYDFEVTTYAHAAGTENGLVSYWNFDEGGGSTAQDSSGSNNQGTIYGAAWIDEKFGHALEFDGINGNVTAPFIPLYNRSFTITAWVNAKSVPNDSASPIFTQCEINDTDKFLRIAIQDTKPYFGFYADDLEGNTILNPNTRYHIACVYNNDTNSKLIYVNGALDASGPSLSPYQGSSGDTIIGGFLNNVFNGTIDEVRIYDRALNQSEVKAVIASGAIDAQTAFSMYRETRTITFTWNTTGFPKGNYTISTYARQVPYEAGKRECTYTNGIVYVGIPGDVDGNGFVEVKDILAIAIAYGSYPGDPPYKPCLDVNGDEFIDVKDILASALNYGQSA